MLAAIGAAIVPFGYWLSHVYYFVGVPVLVLGVVLVLRDNPPDSEWSPDLPDVPVVGDLRGFHGSGTFDSSDGAGDGGD
jgi:hypothetical protein